MGPSLVNIQLGLCTSGTWYGGTNGTRNWGIGPNSPSFADVITSVPARVSLRTVSTRSWHLALPHLPMSPELAERLARGGLLDALNAGNIIGARIPSDQPPVGEAGCQSCDMHDLLLGSLLG